MSTASTISHQETPLFNPDVLHAQVLDRINRLLQEALPEHVRGGASSGRSRLRELGLSSLRLITFIVALENEFELDDADLAELNREMTLETLARICVRSQSRLQAKQPGLIQTRAASAGADHRNRCSVHREFS